jgi:hypothetical protein
VTNSALALDDVEFLEPDERDAYNRFARAHRVRLTGRTSELSEFPGPVVFSCEELIASPTMARRTAEFKVERLTGLQVGWNNGRGNPPTPDAVAAARELIPYLPPRSIDYMSAVPTNRGGIQLEWHAGGVDVEILIEPEGTVDVVIEGAGHDTDGDLTSTLLPLLQALAFVG